MQNAIEPNSVVKRSGNEKPPIEVVILSIGIILLMFKSNRILYVRFISEVLIYVSAFACVVYYTVIRIKNLERITLFKGVCIMLLALIFVYDRMRLGEINAFSIICLFITIFSAAVVVQCPLYDKKTILLYFKTAVEIILVIALIGWIPFLMGVNMPHFQDTGEAYYKHEVYYLFNTFAINNPNDIYRFAGPFLEPGHLGTMCAFLLYIDGYRLRKPGNIILLVSTIMSLSLAAYGLVVGGVIIMLFDRRKYITMSIIAGIFVLIGIGATIYLNGDNVLNKAIVSRLEITENGELAGYNRTTMVFDVSYDRYLKTDKVWLGVGRVAFGSSSDSRDNITLGNAGYKRYFYLRGIVGSALIILLLTLYMLKYRSFKSVGFFIIYVVANLIRDYPTKEIWMYLYLIAMPLLALMPRGNYNLFASIRSNGTVLPTKYGKKNSKQTI